MHERLQRYLRDRVAAEREAVPAGAFTLYVHPTEDHPFLNYAIPNEGAAPDDGSALAAAAGERGLMPRVEAVQPCAPWVGDMPGYEIEDELRLMATEAPIPQDSEAEIVVVTLEQRRVAYVRAAEDALLTHSALPAQNRAPCGQIGGTGGDSRVPRSAVRRHHSAVPRPRRRCRSSASASSADAAPGRPCGGCYGGRIHPCWVRSSL